MAAPFAQARSRHRGSLGADLMSSPRYRALGPSRTWLKQADRQPVVDRASATRGDLACRLHRRQAEGMVRMLPLIVLAGAIGTGAHAASPAKTECATYGRVRVAVTYRLLHSNRWDVRLVIERAARRIYDGRVPPDAQVA